MKTRLFLIVLLSSLTFSISNAQQLFSFSPVVECRTTEVKSQDRTGTCWAFSTISFLESEIMRMGGPKLDLSEMYIVNHAYQNKAKQYVMMHGKGNFSQGGQAHDVINVVEKHGLVFESDFMGRKDASTPYDHSDLEIALKSMLDGLMENKKATPSDVWFKNVESIIMNCMGAEPQSVSFNNRLYPPVQFSEGLGVKAENYIELTSYTHHPFYTWFSLEVPDNWSNDLYYNIPIDELVATMKTALSKGFTIVWDGDVSDDFFSHKNGVAIYPKNRSKKEFFVTEEEYVSQEKRQEAFTTWQATDDHLMHIVGMVKDQKGTVYFKTKNSWGTKNNPYGGYVYLSEQYVRMNTVAIMLHKEGLGKKISGMLKGM